MIEEKMKLFATSNLGAYLRKMAIDGYIIQVDYSAIKEQTAEIQKIGVNINQIVFSVPPTIDLHAFCTLLSYHDRVTVTLTVDANLFSEAQCNAMLEAFNEDLNAIVASVRESTFCLCFPSGES